MGLESPQHECGITGVYSPKSSVSSDIYYALIALQNRGQQNSGMCVFNEYGTPLLRKGPGLVYNVFNEENIKPLRGDIGVGHNRYGTTGGPSISNAQPFLLDSDLGPFAFVHNGNIFNAQYLKDDLEARGENFESTSDSEVIARLIACSPGHTFVEKIKAAAPRFEGAYSFIIATKDSLIGVRDPRGFWPLSLGKVNGSGHMFASETNALDRVGGKFLKEVENGEIIVVDREGISRDSLGKEQESLCSFEFYYFSDPLSIHLGKRVRDARRQMGRLLAKEHPLKADLVVPVPETAWPIAEGYAEASGISLNGALVRNRWLGRTFIEPSQRMREEKAKGKYGVLPEEVDGKRVIVVDDSIVRGTTTARTINLFWEAGAKEVHVLISAPPIIRECHLGVDTADASELIAAHKRVDEVRDFIKASYLGYLSLESGIQAMGLQLRDRLCASCFTGKYLMQVPQRHDKFILEKAHS
ncbi:amidophosphoribosyltransferase [Candidatus Daviesbacteria bacterium RIFCSPLOWO2_01_FULL_43_38]|uniref:Amidophosphoribosyltransferase n=2 Tax=Candidatus Daviesiibacteriota TaxID=1752718 RepID=A0A1F5JZX0_9BACT|nr:MAG: amidophosphoribosyltransferase [Candidatus Daviesbacteria bacterium RIFCSPHIGHO2_12_FULL_43_11]OGE63787.1 MAG: amidophosphoribosyltransferase [Candidatus Daviesbacteria bacterium RIFCSPLOWO2_01_FULL_43_38]OGE69084.1 MAG: amidophosphoribosyltransferase [Candidatus Daviesbacteria bacterium RIFCSPLOWO2_02_FULL_43_11]